MYETDSRYESQQTILNNGYYTFIRFTLDILQHRIQYNSQENPPPEIADRQFLLEVFRSVITLILGNL